LAKNILPTRTLQSSKVTVPNIGYIG